MTHKHIPNWWLILWAAVHGGLAIWAAFYLFWSLDWKLAVAILLLCSKGVEKKS